MKKFLILSLLALALAFAACGSKYKYETVKGDPLQTRIYTLPNGLTVYMSVNKETPRIQSYIAVKVGGKNDPAQTTGLAHYFEHLMFKGTPSFGTSNYEAEKPLLDQIESLFETYRKTTNEVERAAIYRRIDSISYEASKYAIPNEYDKLMSIIGATGVNAFTAKDVTVYMENIPSNQFENWATIQSDRFRNPVIRGFHTELETIYEEKNMSLTNDTRKVEQALDEALYPNHPYGQQTVLGTQESLKNPSISNVKNYHATYYVPNNMAICLSGDFDPDQMIAMIDKYFGDMKPNDNLPKLKYEPEQPITTPIVSEVFGPDAENISLAWRIGNGASDDAQMAELVAQLLSNGKAGLIDVDINQQQRVLNAGAYASIMADYGRLQITGYPKAGQNLDEVRDLLLAEVAKLRTGDFEESLLRGVLNNLRMSEMSQRESNEGRVDNFLLSYLYDIPWEQAVNKLDNLSKITKEQVVAWAEKNLGPANYATIYKRQGADPAEMNISKPQITPIIMNRDLTSDFVTRIQNSTVQPIEPSFLDYTKDLSTFRPQEGVEVLYKRNETNDLFTLTYLFETGATDNPRLETAMQYIEYLGTPNLSSERIYRELYDLACDFSISTRGNRSMITISGLSENMTRAMEIVEELLAHAQPNEQILQSLKADQFQSRMNDKLNQDANFLAMLQSLYFGNDLIRRATLTNESLLSLTSEQLLGDLRDLTQKEHRILYYGPQSEKELRDNLAKHHKTVEHPAKLTGTRNAFQSTPENKVYVIPYEAPQARFLQFSSRGEQFNAQSEPEIALYNEYFGSGMNSVVFQEMREARSLAYTAEARLISPSFADTNYGVVAYIATQNDKLKQAGEAFAEIIDNMPESEAAFNIAKEAILARLRTQRTVKNDILWSYIQAQDLGLTTDRNKELFEKVQSMTLADLKAAQQKWIKGRTYIYGVLGDPRSIDMQYLSTLGPVQIVPQEEVFGY